MSQPEKIGESRAYWTQNVEAFPSPVAQFRMAQLIDLDERLYETARVVYRFLVGWYHDGHGDALLSQRHVAKVMKQRAPAGATVPSRNAVQRAIIALMDTGWVVRTFQGRGKGKGASRYVPVLNVLELAAQGKFPEPAHATGPVEPAHANGPLVARTNGPVDGEPAHATGPKTLPPDSATEPKTGMVELNDCAAPMAGLTAATGAQGGIDELYVAYGVRKEFAAARIEYEKLAPSPELHAEMVAAAKAWRGAAGGIERMHLARWIREERFREDPKGDRKPREPKAANSNKPARPRTGRRIIDIVDAEVTAAPGCVTLVLSFAERDTPTTWTREIILEHRNSKKQTAGHREFARLCDALGLRQSPTDAEELIGGVVGIDVAPGGGIEYSEAA